MTEVKTKRIDFRWGRVVLEFLEYALMFTVIIECNSLFHYSENYRKTSLEIVVTMFALIMVGVLTCVYGYRHRKELIGEMRKYWPVLTSMMATILLFFIANVLRLGAGNALRKYVLSFIFLLPAFCLLFRFYRIEGKPYTLFFKHADLICIIAICNLLVYTAVTVRPDLSQSRLILSPWTSRGHLESVINFLDLCCFNLTISYRIIAGILVFRNQAFFTEPLMYAIPLITALFTEMYLREKEERQIWKWAVLIASVFTTQSTLGMMMAALAVGLKIYEGAGKKRNWRMRLLAILFVGVLFVILLKQKSDIGGNSVAIHLVHYKAAIKAFLQHPLIGCGFLREDQITLFLPPNVSKGLSNSVAVVMAEGGIVLGFLCMAPFFFGLSQIRSRSSRNIAFWILGPLGLYCVTVFHFHLLLMLFMAFGYSMLELSSDSDGKRKLVLAEETETTVTEHPAMTGHIARGIVTFLALVIIALLFICEGFWRIISHWLEFHQLYLGQSTWKVYFFSLFLMLIVLVIRHTLTNSDRGTWVAETVFFFLYNVLFAIAYPTAYSVGSTVLEHVTFFGDLFETAALALIYFGGIFVGWLMVSWFRVSRWHAAVSLGVVVLLGVGTATGCYLFISRIDMGTAEIASIVEEASQIAEGRVYANEKPAAMKRAIPAITYAPARDGAFAALEKASVLTAHDRVLRDLTDVGFEVAELSPEFLLYSNDTSVIEMLRGKGYTFYRYYPFELQIDHEASVMLRDGTYTLDVQLQKVPREEDFHEPECYIVITSYYGTKQILQKTVFADEFDANGYCSVEVPFRSGDWEGMEYSIVSENGKDAPKAVMMLKATPEYITQSTFNGRHQVTREAYFDVTGVPYYQKQGYAARTKEYDHAGHLIREAYYDEEDHPVCIQAGYASYRRYYNGKGQQIKENYYDEDGALCLRLEGYASVERTYNEKGDVILLRYLDETQQPILTTLGYAEIRRVYNEKRQLLEECYYDETGEKATIPQGYWLEKREYDDAGNVIAQRYYDINGNAVIITSGYAEVRKEYNDAKQVIYEAYFGINSEPVALPNGVASMWIEFDERGREIMRHNYDLYGKDLSMSS